MPVTSHQHQRAWRSATSSAVPASSSRSLPNWRMGSRRRNRLPRGGMTPPRRATARPTCPRVLATSRTSSPPATHSAAARSKGPANVAYRRRNTARSSGAKVGTTIRSPTTACDVAPPRCAWCAVEDLHAVPQSFAQVLYVHAGRPSGGQFDGQWNTVQPLADLGNSRSMPLRVIRRVERAGPHGEQLRRGVLVSGGTVMTRSSVNPSRSRDVARTRTSDRPRARVPRGRRRRPPPARTRPAGATRS